MQGSCGQTLTLNLKVESLPDNHSLGQARVYIPDGTAFVAAQRANDDRRGRQLGRYIHGRAEAKLRTAPTRAQKKREFAALEASNVDAGREALRNERHVQRFLSAANGQL